MVISCSASNVLFLNDFKGMGIIHHLMAFGVTDGFWSDCWLCTASCTQFVLGPSIQYHHNDDLLLLADQWALSFRLADSKGIIHCLIAFGVICCALLYVCP
jgi:hypothetical protein